MATPQHDMEAFLSTIDGGKTSVWTAYFSSSTITLTSGREEHVRARVDLQKYPCDVRKDFIQKLRLAGISSLAIADIAVGDGYLKSFLSGAPVDLPNDDVVLAEDIAEIIKALQSTPTAEESKVVGDGKSQNGEAECKLKEAAVSSTHQIDVNNRTLTNISIRGNIPPQKLKAVCSLIVAPGSSVKSIALRPTLGPSRESRLCCTLLEEMLSAQKEGGSCPALERLIFDGELVWNGASLEHIGEFLRRTPSIKEIVFDPSSIDHEDVRIEESLAEKLAEALCLNNQVHALRFKTHCLELQEAVMRVLMRDSQRPHPITALTCLHLEFSRFPSKSFHFVTRERNAILLLEFIKTTTCLHALHILSDGLALPLELIEALKFNHGLEHFAWGGDYGLDDDDAIFSAVMDALRVNYQLKDIVYSWQNKYCAEALRMLFEERATNKPWEVMKDMVLVPSTSARLFFCGYPHAGDFLWLVYVCSTCMQYVKL